MKSMLVFIFLAITSLAAQAEGEDQLRFGLQGSMNQYTVDDPLGPTAKGSGPGVSGILIMELGRESRAVFTVSRDAYTIKGTQTNVGQDVTSFGGGASYQSMFRVARTFKPWIGIGAGYALNTQKNRHLFTAGGNRNFYPDIEEATYSLLLNANSEWQFNREWDIGVMAQYAHAISDKSSSIRVGLYFIY